MIHDGRNAVYWLRRSCRFRVDGTDNLTRIRLDHRVQCHIPAPRGTPAGQRLSIFCLAELGIGIPCPGTPFEQIAGSTESKTHGLRLVQIAPVNQIAEVLVDFQHSREVEGARVCLVVALIVSTTQVRRLQAIDIGIARSEKVTANSSSCEYIAQQLTGITTGRRPLYIGIPREYTKSLQVAARGVLQRRGIRLAVGQIGRDLDAALKLVSKTHEEIVPVRFRNDRHILVDQLAFTKRRSPEIRSCKKAR